MKRTYLYILAATALLSCSSESSEVGIELGEGNISFVVSSESEVEGDAIVRSESTIFELDSELIPAVGDMSLAISGTYIDATTLEQGIYDTLYTVESFATEYPLMPASADYSATVSYGDSTAEGESLPYFEGIAPFEVVARGERTVEITAKLSNSIICFAVADDFQQYFKDEQLQITTSAGSVFTFDRTHDSDIFVEAGTTLTFDGTATKADDMISEVVTFNSTVIGTTEARHRYEITISSSTTSSGGIDISISGESTFVDVENELNQNVLDSIAIQNNKL